MPGVESAPLKRMTTPTAKRLEGLISMYQDLRYVMQLTHAAVEMMKADGDNDPFLLRTYWAAALNAYARPYKNGVRQQRLQPVIFTGIEGAPETHQYFMDQRDKLIAHSVNPFEEVAVGVFTNSTGKVIGTGELAGQLVATSEEGFKDLNQLAKIATVHLEGEITQYKDLLLKEALQLSANELLQLKNVRLTAPDPSKAASDR